MKPSLAFVATLALLAGCNAKKSDVISSLEERNQTVLKIKALTAGPFTKLLAEEPLDPADKAAVEEAQPLVKKLVEFSPNEPESYVLLGRTQWVLGDTASARKSLEKGVEMQQKYPGTSDPLVEAEAHHDLARLAMLEQRWGDASKEAAAAVKLFPDQTMYLMTQATAQLQNKDVDGARTSASQALKIDPQNSRAVSMLKMIAASETDGPAKGGT